MVNAPGVYLSAIKSYGDLVITRAALSRVSGAVPGFILGGHLLELNNVLGVLADQLVWHHREADVPSLFDVRKRGIGPAIRSAWHLRAGFMELKLPALTQVAFAHDDFSVRERFITGGRAIPVLKGQRSDSFGNIYLAHDAFLTNLGVGLKPAPQRPALKTTGTALIIPGARMAHRVIPESTVDAISEILAGHGIQSKVVTLMGENVREPARLASVTLPRNFGVLAREILAADLIVCADSLPSHLSEYFGIPTFVATPRPKQFWLPRLAYLNDGWATFEELQPLKSWIDRQRTPLTMPRGGDA